jgi:carboxyl-terminal processing protease
MPRRNLGWLLGTAAVTILGLAIAYSAPLREKDRDYELVRLMVEVLDEVDHKYVRELDADAKRRLVEDMLNAGLERLDLHSSYIPPKEYKHFNKQSKGKFGGIGVQISVDRQSGFLQVISPMVGTPAYEAGILAGDRIVKIDGKSTEHMLLNEAIDLIQGDPGQKITLTVVHEGKRDEVDIELVRAEIQIETVIGDLRKPDSPKEWDFVLDRQKKVGYIRLVSSFNENTAGDLRRVVEQLQKEGIRGYILDLRNNPGGLLQVARDVADIFLHEGRIVSTKGRNQQEKVYNASSSNTLLMPAREYPMAVLVNRYSASASEIVAAALQDHHRAVILGERTFGKGSVQEVIPLEGRSSALKLTTSSYWRPNGHNMHRFPDSKESDEWGVKPDPGFEIKLTSQEWVDFWTARRDRDVVYGKSGARPPSDTKEKKPFVDKVLDRAVEHIDKELQKRSGAE